MKRSKGNQLRSLVVMFAWLLTSVIFAQNITVTGKVTDNVFKEPVIGATIVI